MKYLYFAITFILQIAVVKVFMEAGQLIPLTFFYCCFLIIGIIFFVDKKSNYQIKSIGWRLFGGSVAVPVLGLTALTVFSIVWLFNPPSPR
jgi:hypothetical protein